MWESEWWELYKTDVSVEEHLRDSSPYKQPLHHDKFLDKVEAGAIFSRVQCDINVPEHLRGQFAIFPPFSKNTNVCGDDIGP